MPDLYIQELNFQGNRPSTNAFSETGNIYQKEFGKERIKCLYRHLIYVVFFLLFNKVSWNKRNNTVLFYS